MNLFKHALINSIVALLLSFLFLNGFDLRFFLIVVSAGVLIDIDHFFIAIKDGMIKSPVQLARYWVKNAVIYTGKFYIFHTFEFLIALLAVGLLLQNFVLISVFIGFLLHLAADAVTNFSTTRNARWVANYSIFCVIFM